MKESRAPANSSIREVAEASRAFWGLRLGEAHRYLRHQDSVRARLVLADIQLTIALLSESSESFSAAERALRRVASARGTCAPSTTMQPQQAFDDQVCLAHAKLWTACLLLRQGGYITGAIRLRQAWKQFKALQAKIDANPHQFWAESCDDVMFGIGFFLFFVSLVPDGFRAVVRLIGFDADRVSGKRKLRAVSQNTETPRAPAAMLLLFWIESVFYENHEVASSLYEESQLLFGDAPLFDYLGGYLIRKLGNVEEALCIFHKVRQSSSEIYELYLMSWYEIGWCYFILERWQQAIESLSYFLDHFHSPSFRAYAGYQLGYSFAMINKHERAVEILKKVPSWVRPHYSFDSHAGRKARIYLSSQGLSPFEREMVIANGRLERNDFAGAGEFLDNIEHRRLVDCDKFGDESAQFLYLRGRVKRALKLYEDALELFRRVYDMRANITQEIYLVPHSLTEMGEIYMHLSQNDTARAMFTEAQREYKNFDFDKPLGRRISLNLDKLDGNSSE